MASTSSPGDSSTSASAEAKKSNKRFTNKLQRSFSHQGRKERKAN
jgi:hypothetical protein